MDRACALFTGMKYMKKILDRRLYLSFYSPLAPLSNRCLLVIFEQVAQLGKQKY